MMWYLKSPIDQNSIMIISNLIVILEWLKKDSSHSYNIILLIRGKSLSFITTPNIAPTMANNLTRGIWIRVIF